MSYHSDRRNKSYFKHNGARQHTVYAVDSIYISEFFTKINPN